jgi:hypothetical protein
MAAVVVVLGGRVSILSSIDDVVVSASELGGASVLGGDSSVLGGVSLLGGGVSSSQQKVTWLIWFLVSL